MSVNYNTIQCEAIFTTEKVVDYSSSMVINEKTPIFTEAVPEHRFSFLLRNYSEALVRFLFLFLFLLCDTL